MCWLFSYCQTLLADYFSIHSGVDVPICTDFSGIDAWFLMCELGYFISSYRLSPYKFRFFPISNYRIHRSGMIFLLYFCCKPKKNIMKKILFILFTVQFILIPRITGSYGANSIGNNHGHSVTNQGKKTIKKDIFGDTVIEDNHGNRKTI